MALLCFSCGGAGHVTVSLALHSGLGGVNATGAIVCTRCKGARWVPECESAQPAERVELVKEVQHGLQ